MRIVNETFDLPNPPPSRFERILKNVKEAVTGAIIRLPRLVKHQEREPTRVSHKYENYAVWAMHIDLYVETNT